MSSKSGKKRKKRKKSKSGSSSSVGGAMMSLRSGFKGVAKSVVGADEPKKKPSLISNIFWGVLTAALLGLLVYRVWRLL